jgi:hypothetical protein
MPPSSSDANVVLEYTRTAASMLGDISDAINVPLLNAVSEGIMPVISMVQVGFPITLEAVVLSESRMSGPIRISVSG